jgi:sugar lactone lactonase YvrE
MNTPLDKIVKESKLFKTMFGNMYNTNGIGFDPEHDYMISRDTDKPIIYKNPNKDAMARHPRYMVNFPCQVYCNTTIDGRNRRDIENV